MYTSKTFFAVIVAEFPGYWIQDQHIYKLKFISTHGLKNVTSINFFVRTKYFPEKSCSVANGSPWTDGRTTKANVRIPGDHSVQRSKCSQPGNLCNANLKRMTFVGNFTLDRCWSVLAEKAVSSSDWLIYAARVLRNISNTKDRVWSHFQTSRRELKIRRVAEYFWRPSGSLEMWSNSVLSAWYIFSIELKTKERA